MNTTQTTKKRREAAHKVMEKMAAVREAVNLQIPDTEGTPPMAEEVFMKSIWTEQEMDILKLKLLDLVEEL